MTGGIYLQPTPHIENDDNFFFANLYKENCFICVFPTETEHPFPLEISEILARPRQRVQGTFLTVNFRQRSSFCEPFLAKKNLHFRNFPMETEIPMKASATLSAFLV